MGGRHGARSDWGRGSRRAADAALAVATVVAITTVFGALAQDRVTSVERHLPAIAIVAAFAGVAVATSAAWVARDVHVGASLGLSIAIVALLLPVWGGWLWLPAAARAARARRAAAGDRRRGARRTSMDRGLPRHPCIADRVGCW